MLHLKFQKTKNCFPFYLENIGENAILGLKILSNEKIANPLTRQAIKKDDLFEINIFDSFKTEKIYRLQFANMKNQWYGIDVRFYKKNNKLFLEPLREKLYFYKNETGTEIVELEK